MTSNNKEKYSLFSYSWDFTEERLEDQREYERTNIKIFGINESGENIYVSIDDFEPFVYLEIPTEIPKDKYSLIPDAIDGRIIEKYGTYKNGEPKFGPTSKTLVYRKKLYFTHKDKNMKDIEFPYILMTFSTMSHVKKFGFALFNQIHIKGVGRFKFKLHEQDASPILQLISRRNLPSAGWIEFTGVEVDEDNKESYCQKEYKTSWKKLVPSAKTTSVNPLVMAVDIEVNSSNPNVMPNADNAKDKVFQISCVVARTGQEEKDFAKYILSLGEPDQKITGEDVIIKSYKRECDLLDGYAELINTLNPNIIVGYNVFGFDFPYMIKRADNTNCDNFRKQGFIAGKSGKEKIIKWSSSAYKNQEFRFLDCYGILFIDLLPIIKRDFKFDNYRLKTIAEFFTGKTKDPLTPKDIFSCYRKFTPKSLGIVAKYCVQDSVLVLKLVDVLKTWVGLTEMAKTCNVPIITLFTQGQQIKIYSQVFKFCLNTYVVEKDAFVTGSDEKYTGAFVFDPVPGLYDMVVSFDFSSLYPSSIIAYNIDYSTLVRDENIPDDKCHVIEWEEHKNCIHDEVVRKGKQTEKTCQKYRYRFLKEPKGIIPTILQNMLDMRKKTNGEISVLKDKLKEEKNEEKIKDIKTMIDVLDKRQLSYKVNANSMYGGMGVKKGYLPFLPGAMCTTAKGRESIAKASKYIQEHYGGKLIYGDSVTGDTPIMIKYEDETIDIVRIDEIGEVWNDYEEFKKEDSNRKEKQQTYPYKSSGEHRIMNFIKVWTGEEWSLVKRVIRHKTVKKMYRVLTHTGCVDVTEDHSLLDENKQKIKPTEVGIGSKLYHSFPPLQDFVEMEVKDSVIEGKVLECKKCSEYKLVIEFDNYDIEKVCKGCKSEKNNYFSQTEYLKNPAKGLDEDLAYVWGFFMCDGVCKDNQWSITSNILNKIVKSLEILNEKEKNITWKLLKNNGFFQIIPSGQTNFLINKYSKLFFGKEHTKKIPYFILNGSDKIKYSFLSGAGISLNTKNKIYNYSKLTSQGFYVLLSSLGYKIDIDMSVNDSNTLQIKDNIQSENTVKDIIQLHSVSDNEYVYDIETESGRFMGGIGKMILKNTDSCYVNFPMFNSDKDAGLCYDFCKRVEDEMLSLFPRPMKLAYEEKIYWRFFILTKKRYMALVMDRNGKVSNNIFKRGVLLNRRDNSKFIRDIYSDTILKIFYKSPQETILQNLIDKINNLYTKLISSKDMVVTKAVGSLQDYKIKVLSEDDKKCKKRLVELLEVDGEVIDNIDLDKVRELVNKMISEKAFSLEVEATKEYEIARQYLKKSLPSQVQLSIRMAERGKAVDAGTRLEYVIINYNGSEKLFDKIEDIDYYKEHSSVLELDCHYYLKLLSKPIDQMLNVAFGVDKFIEKHYKQRLIRSKLNNELKNITKPKIEIIN